MTDVVTYRMELSIEDGPSVAPDDHFDAQSYTKIEANIPKNSVATTINVQPSPLTELQAILITAERYEDLTFVVDEGIVPVTLDGPLMLIGTGLIALLAGTPGTLNDLVFENASATADNMVTILLARTAIEPLGE